MFFCNLFGPKSRKYMYVNLLETLVPSSGANSQSVIIIYHYSIILYCYYYPQQRRATKLYPEIKKKHNVRGKTYELELPIIFHYYITPLLS